MEAQLASSTNAADIPHRSTSSWGLLGPLSPELVHIIFDDLDLPTLLVAHNVCRAWRRFLDPRWRTIFLGFEKVDSTIKWRMRSLDGDEGYSRDEYHKNDLIPMTEEGDGRGVSGPPLDIVTQMKLAVRSDWGHEVRTEVVDKLPSDSPLREELLDPPGQTSKCSMDDRVYQWGTRLDKPDWHQLCALHIVTERNLKHGRNVHTKIVPLYIPKGEQLQMLGVDPGDDCLLFRTGGEHRVRAPVIVECSTGQVRYFSPSDDHYYKFTENIGMTRLSTFDSVQVSGQAVNRLVGRDTGDRSVGTPPDRYLQRVGKDVFRGRSDGISFRNIDDQTMEVARSEFRGTLQWGKLSSLVGEQPTWDHSVKLGFHSWASPILTDRYVLNKDKDSSKVFVYSKADESLVASIPAGISHEGSFSDESAQVALFSFSLKMYFAYDGSDLHVRPFSLPPQTASEDSYWQAVRQAIWERISPREPAINGLFFSGKHLFLEMTGGYLVIPNFDSVVARAELEEPSERSRFIAQRTLLIHTIPGPYHAPPTVSAGRLFLSTIGDDYGWDFCCHTVILDIDSLPPIDPASPVHAPLWGVAIMTPILKGAYYLWSTVSGGRIFQHFRISQSLPGPPLGRTLSKNVLRITSFEPRLPQEEESTESIGNGCVDLNLEKATKPVEENKS